MATSRLDTHLNFRLSTEDKCLITEAARALGIKPQLYARKKLIEAANKDVAKKNPFNQFQLSSEEWEQVMDLMEAPIVVNQNLKKAVKKFKRMFS